MPKLIFVTREWAGLGLALLAKSQGSDVLCAYSYDKKKQEDLDEAQQIGDGLLDKVPLEKATRELIQQGNLWVFDGNELPAIADRLRNAGEAVIGTSTLAAKIEHDRSYAAEVAKSVGLALPETHEFSDYQVALDFLETNEDKAYVYKPDEGDPTATYVPQNRDDLSQANLELREYIISLQGDNAKPKFILQEIVEGTEVAFDAWFRDGRIVAVFMDLEAKRKLTGDLGENIGCAGDYVSKIAETARGVKDTVVKYQRWKELKNYTGSVDVNVIYVRGKPLFLENCFRFAYNAYPAMFHSLAQESVEVILREWVEGKGRLDSMFRPGFAGSLTLTNDEKPGPILIPKEVMDSVDLYRAYSDEGHLCSVGEWQEIACVIAHGATIEAAGASCLALAKEVSMPNKGYRVDLASASLPTLPLARYRALAANGLLR